MNTKSVSRSFLVLSLLAFLAVDDSAASGTKSTCAESSVHCDEVTKARRVDGPQPIALNFNGFTNPLVRCRARAENPARPGNHGQNGVKFEIGMDFFSPQGAQLGQDRISGRTRRDGYFDGLLDVPPGASIATGGCRVSGSRKVHGVSCKCWATDTPPCEPDENTLCLEGNRFRVEAGFGSQGTPGQVFNPRDDVGILFFTNTDLLVRLLDNCQDNDHFWVFYQATTNIPFTMTVTDTQTGEVRRYKNPGAFQPIEDTSAFATCP